MFISRLKLIVPALIFVLFGPVSAGAQHAAVRGFVTDGSTEQTLQGASAVLQDANGVAHGAASDGDGFFQINRVVPGTYTLRITFVGFTPYEEEVQLRSGDLIERVVALSPREELIDELVVEAEAEGGVTAVIAGLESVVPAEIARVPVPGVSGDLASYLQTVPGIVVQGDRGGQFYVRGGAVDQNLAMLDGLPVYMPFHILSFYSAFPEEIVDRADVYTGGFGARYGTRVSSVIDVQARNGNKQNLAGSVAIAPFLSAAQIEGPIWKNRVSLIASVRQSLIEEIFPDMFGQRMPYRFGDRFGKLHALVGDSHSFSVTVLDTDDRGDIAGTKKTFDGEVLSEAITDSTEVAWTNRVYGGSYTFRSNGLPLVVKLTAGRSEMTSDFGPEDFPERQAEVSSTDLIGSVSWLLKSGSINAGVSWRKTDLSYALDDIYQDYTADQQELSELDAYVETVLRLNRNRLTINPGAHLYALTDQSRSWVDPRVRVSFYPDGPTGGLQFNAAWGIYRQSIVGLNDERDLGNLFTAWVTTPEDADVSRSQHAILGANVRVMPWLNLAAEGYRKTYSNLSVPVFSAFPGFTTALQSADGEAYGVDVRLDVQDRPFLKESVLDGYVSYAWSNVEYETASGVTYHPGHERRHQLNALLHAQKGEVGVTVQFQMGSGLPFTESGGFDKWLLLTPDVDVGSDPGVDRVVYNAPFEGRQPTYTRMDVWLEKRIDRGRYVTTLRAGAVNIFNQDNLFYYDLFTFKRVDQLPLIPSIGLKVELR